MDGVPPIEKVGDLPSHCVWVPNRRDMKHKCFKVQLGLPQRKKKSALELQILSWSPFENTGYAVAWSGEQASVYAWDKKLLEKIIKKNGYTNMEIVPEAFLKAKGKDGTRLLNTNDGFEAQLWDNGVLKASRWWESPPNSAAWLLFTRSVGGNISDYPPPPEQLQFLDFPWHITQYADDILMYLLKNSKLVSIFIVILAMPLAYLMAQTIAYNTLTYQLQKKITDKEQDSLGIRLDRRVAIKTLAEVNSLISLQKFPHQIQVLSEAHKITSPYSLSFSEWNYNSGALEFSINSESGVDTRVLIAAFENHSLFSSVRASTRGSRTIIKMNIQNLTQTMKIKNEF